MTARRYLTKDEKSHRAIQKGIGKNSQEARD